MRVYDDDDRERRHSYTRLAWVRGLSEVVIVERWI